MFHGYVSLPENRCHSLSVLYLRINVSVRIIIGLGGKNRQTDRTIGDVSQYKYNAHKAWN